MAKQLKLNDSEVQFIPESHEYRFQGKQLSGITNLLHRQLFPNEFDGISEAAISQAAQYGTSVHHSIEEFDSSWNNDGTVEVADYIEICKNNGLIHEASEYTVSDNRDYASNIDKVYRTGDSSFSIADIKTYGVMTPEKLEKARWQLSVYRYMFMLQNPKAKVDRLFIIHLRNRLRRDGETYDHISSLIPVDPIPSEIIKDLLETDLRGEQFNNPFSIPADIKNQEERIRTLISEKAQIEEELGNIKSNILSSMEILGIKSWMTDTMRLTRKLPTTRSSFNLQLFKKDHPEYDYDSYMKESQVSGSLLISI